MIRDALSGEQFAGFCGLTPFEKKSGKSTGQAHMSKAYPTILRWALFLVADCIRKYDPKLKDLYQRVKNRHKSQGKKIARLVGACAVARELAMLIWAVVKFQRPYFLQQEEYKKFVASLYPKIIRSLSNLQDENWNVKSKNK
ncbi:MAG: transposase [bacterium]